MANIKLPEKPGGTDVIVLNPVYKNLSRFKLSGWPRERKLNLKLSLFHLRTFARKFPNIDFFLKTLPLKDDELVMSEM